MKKSATLATMMSLPPSLKAIAGPPTLRPRGTCKSHHRSSTLSTTPKPLEHQLCITQSSTPPIQLPPPQGSYQPSPSPQSYHQLAPSAVGDQNTHSPASYHPTPSPMAISPSPSPVGYSPMTPGAPSPGGYNPHSRRQHGRGQRGHRDPHKFFKPRKVKQKKESPLDTKDVEIAVGDGGPESSLSNELEETIKIRKQGSSDWVTTNILFRVSGSRTPCISQDRLVLSGVSRRRQCSDSFHCSASAQITWNLSLPPKTTRFQEGVSS